MCREAARQNVRQALTAGIHGTGEGKLLIFFECSGLFNAREIHEAFPLAQFVSTTDLTSDKLSPVAFNQMLQGFAHGDSWEKIRAAVKTKIAPLLSAEQSIDHYCYPDQSLATETDEDRDGDGIADVSDPLFNVVTRNREPAPASFEPLRARCGDQLRLVVVDAGAGGGSDSQDVWI